MGWICKKIKLPSLLGMMITGMILGPYILNLLDDSILGISAELRKIALIIILTRAGLGLDLSGLKKIGRPAVMMCFVPATFEIVGIVLLAPKLMGLSILEAAIMGAVLAAVSPAASREQDDREHHKPENQISDNETTGGNEEQEIKEKEDKPVPVEAKPYKVLSAEDKMKHFKTIMDGIVTEALQRNNVQLENTMISQVTDVVIQELGKVEERQEGQSERYYKLLDEAIRGKQRAGREVAAAKVPSYGVPKRRKRLFKRKFRY